MPNKIAAAAIAAVALAAFLFVGFYVVDAGIQTSLHDVTVTNESFTPSGGDLTTFDNSELNRADYDETVTVRNASDGSVFDASGNYTWFAANGTLETTANSDLADASSATITYGYNGQTAEQTATTNIIIEFMGIMVPLAFIGFVSFLFVAMFVMGRWA